MTGRSVLRRLFTSALAITHGTELAASRLGTAYFLPALFVDRFTHLGGIDNATFTEQLDRCRSFRDQQWAGHWQHIAGEHLDLADAALARLGAPTVAQLLDPSVVIDIEALGELLAPGAPILAERGAIASPTAAGELIAANDNQGADAITAVDNLVKAITYKFAASWPGWTPERLAAYAEQRRLTDILVAALAPAMGVRVEHIDIPVTGGDVVHGTAIFPLHAHEAPLLLASNGLEGTVAEMLLPSLKYRPESVAMFVMEMPGTFLYKQPLAAEGTAVYKAVIDHLAADSRVDAERIAMFALSFGAHFATRMAAEDPRLRAVVANGAPTHRTFQPAGTIGVPEIIVWTLSNATHATNTLDLTRKLGALSLAKTYAKITIPILVINGDEDTLCSTQDSIDLAIHAPDAQLELYPNDDHCAMGHSPEWMQLSMDFVSRHLGVEKH